MVPVDSVGGWPGAIHILFVKVQSPASRASFFCGSPGAMAFIIASISALLIAGASFGFSSARAGSAARASRDSATTRDRAFIMFPPLRSLTWVDETTERDRTGDPILLNYAALPRKIPPQAGGVN